MEHCGDDVIIDNLVIAVDHFQNRRDAIDRLSEDPCGEDTGDI